MAQRAQQDKSNLTFHVSVDGIELENLINRSADLIAESLARQLAPIIRAVVGQQAASHEQTSSEASHLRMSRIGTYEQIRTDVTSKRGTGVPIPGSELISVRSVATQLNVSQRHVWKLVASGALPEPVRIGRSVRWRMAEIRKWIDGGCRRVD